MNLSNNQWVLLHHQVDGPIGDRGDHFDFMLSPVGSLSENTGSEKSSSEDPGHLWTWAIPVNPLELSLPQECIAERLPDHRLAYLEYEGPISGNRGHVQRVASGTYEVVSWSEERIELRLQCIATSPTGHDDLFLVSLSRQGEIWKLIWSAHR